MQQGSPFLWNKLFPLRAVYHCSTALHFWKWAFLLVSQTCITNTFSNTVLVDFSKSMAPLPIPLFTEAVQARKHWATATQQPINKPVWPALLPWSDQKLTAFCVSPPLSPSQERWTIKWWSETKTTTENAVQSGILSSTLYYQIFQVFADFFPQKWISSPIDASLDNDCEARTRDNWHVSV